MIFYEYNNDGWLIGWHEDSSRQRSTTLGYPPIPPSRARFVAGAWVDDPTREQKQIRDAMVAQVKTVVQQRLDSQAQEWGYDDIRSAVGYADEPAVPQFEAEGKVLRAWRSLTWAACYSVASTAQTIEEVLAVLPPAPERPTP